MVKFDLNPDNPNNWADNGVRYIVHVRPPKAGEWFLTGGKLSYSYRDMVTPQPVIISIVLEDDK